MPRRLALVPVLAACIHIGCSADSISGPGIVQRRLDPASEGKIVLGGRLDGSSGFGIISMNEDGSGAVQLTSTNEQTPRLSPDGTRIAFYDDGGDGSVGIYVMDTDGTNPEQITDPPCQDAWPHWSPNGAKIVFSRQCSPDHLYVVDVATKIETQITSGTAQNWYPDWSPDGSRITFVRTAPPDWNYYLYLIDPDGSNLSAPLLTSASPISDPEWSPDGSKIAFSYSGDGIWVINADGSNLTELHPGPSTEHPTWSPDGSRIAYAYGEQEIRAMDSDDGSNDARLSGVDVLNAWQPHWHAPTLVDTDGDGVVDDFDNCPTNANANQTDTDSDGAGNACDADDDDDGILDTIDLLPLTVSDRFSDVPLGGGTAGRVTQVPANTAFVIEDLPGPLGVRVTLTATGPVPASARFRINLDGKSTSIRLAIPGTYEVTDPVSDTTVKTIVAGPAEIEFQLHGQTYVVSIQEGASATITETTNEAGVLQDVTVKDVTGEPGGVTINGEPVTPGGDPAGVASMDGTLRVVRLSRFELEGVWRTTSAVHPAVQEVTLEIGSASFVLSAGKLKQKGAMLTYVGRPASARDVELSLRLQETAPGTWAITASGGPLHGLLLRPVTVSLRVGEVVGSSDLRATLR